MDDRDILRRITNTFRNFSEMKKSYIDMGLHIDCICCHQDAVKNCYSVQGLREVCISGFCEKCFDDLFADED